MSILHIVLTYLCVNQGGIKLVVSQKPLYLLYGHSLVKCSGSHGAAELVRVDPQSRFPAQTSELAFNSSGRNTGMRQH